MNAQEGHRAVPETGVGVCPDTNKSVPLSSSILWGLALAAGFRLGPELCSVRHYVSPTAGPCLSRAPYFAGCVISLWLQEQALCAPLWERWTPSSSPAGGRRPVSGVLTSLCSMPEKELPQATLYALLSSSSSLQLPRLLALLICSIQGATGL